VTEIAARLKHALRRLQVIPSELGETYESVYNLQRRGGVMPYAGPVDRRSIGMTPGSSSARPSSCQSGTTSPAALVTACRGWRRSQSG
jgi:hypothetical protein